MKKILTIIFGILLLIPSVSFASVARVEFDTGNTVIVHLGQGFEELNTFSLSAKLISGTAGQSMFAHVYYGSSSPYMSDFAVTIPSSTSTMLFNFGSSSPPNRLDDIYIYLFPTFSSTVVNMVTKQYGFYQSNCTNTSLCTPQYFYLDNNISGSNVQFGNTRILRQNSPLDGEITPNQSPNFNFDYLLNDVITPQFVGGKAGIEIQNNTIGQTVFTSSLEADILASGQNNYSQNIFIEPIGDSFSWRPYIRTDYSTSSGRTNEYIYGKWQLFSIVTAGQLSSPFTINESNASSTLFGIGSTFSQFNVLQTKFPLNWVFESYDIFVDLQNNTTTIAIPEASQDFAQMPNTMLATYMPNATSTGDWNFTYFGSSTIQAVANTPHWQDLMNLERMILWIGLIYFAWSKKDKLVKI